MINARLEPATTSADWAGRVRLTDNENGQPVDLTGCDIELVARGPLIHPVSSLGARGYSWPDCAPSIRLSTNDGSIEIVDTGIFGWRVPAAVMRGLSTGTYAVGCTMARDGETRQLFLGHFQIVSGIV